MASHNPFLDEVNRVFADFIAKHGLRVFADSYDSESFGDATVVLACDSLQLRLLRDRGQIFVDIKATKGMEWYSLPLTLEAVLGRKIREDGPITVEEAADLLREHFDVLRESLVARNMHLQEKLARLVSKRLGTLFPGYRK